MALPFSTPAQAVDDERPVSAPTASYDPDHILVRFKDDVSQKNVDKALNKHKLKETSDLGSQDDTTLYDVGTSESPASVAKSLKDSGLVELAEPDYNLQPTSISNDPQIGSYWGLDNTGQNVNGQNGINNIDIDAPDAWTAADGSGVIVAVLDEGIDINHPDLSSHIWSSGDCNNNGIDDDHDGYVDDCNGWDFYHNDKTVFDAADGDDHGTHVAGTIAASINNGIGGAGVAPNVTIMPLKFLGPNGGSTSDAILGINYAKAHGAKIVNCSWGGTGYSQALSDTIASSGMLFTVAAGNSGTNIALTPQYPAALNLPNIVTVAAVDNRGNLASFSNYGGTTSVGAPGVSILSTMPKKTAATVALETSPGGSSWKSALWGFGLEAIVGSTARRDALSTELTRLGASSTSPILLVDDDESSSGSAATPDTASYYTAALTAAGFSNVTPIQVTRDADGPSAASMSGKYVIWETGYAYGTSTYTLTNNDMSNLTSFLNGNGKLLMAGSDVIFRNETTTFVQNYLGAKFISEGDTRTAASGVASTPFAGMNLNLSGTESPKGALNPYQDIIAPQSSQATAVIQLNGETNYNQAYGYKDGTSMAAPHVAGIAALCAQIMPSANPVKLANYIKGGVTTLSSLNGKATTSGMVNARKSVQLALTDAYPPTDGYRFAASDGGIFAFGNASFEGSTGGQKLNQPVVGMAATPNHGGYWLVARDGGIFGFGDASFKGSAGGIKLNQAIVGMAATPDGGGYWLVASDGGIFAFGNARFFGSTGGIKLNSPIVGMASAPDGNGYWLVAADGGIFAFGSAGFFGSAGGSKLNKPIVGMSSAPGGHGYWLVASDGGIFAYGDSGFFGSTGAIKLNKPIVGMSTTPDGRGYWLVASDGGVFAYGNAGFWGSTGSIKLNQPIVGMAH